MRARLVAMCVVALGAGGLAACGNDDDDSAIGQIQTDADGPVSDGDVDDGDVHDDRAGSEGNAVVVIGGERFEFEVDCSFGAGTEPSDDESFAMGGSGDGGLQLYVTRVASTDDNSFEAQDSIEIQGGDVHYQALSIPAAGMPRFFEVDGTTVRATTEFAVDGSSVDSVEGTFEATCP